MSEKMVWKREYAWMNGWHEERKCVNDIRMHEWIKDGVNGGRIWVNEWMVWMNEMTWINEWVKKWKLDWGEADPSPCAAGQSDSVCVYYFAEGHVALPVSREQLCTDTQEVNPPTRGNSSGEVLECSLLAAVSSLLWGNYWKVGALQ